MRNILKPEFEGTRISAAEPPRCTSPQRSVTREESGAIQVGRGQARRAKAFFVPLTRFANFGTNVDNAWREIFSLAVNAWQRRIIGGDLAIFDAQISQLDGLVLWINQVNICDAQIGHPATHTINATSAAMKISTYIAIFPDMRGSLGSFI